MDTDLKILKLFKTSDSYVSGEEISSHLDITRSAVWKHIEKLRHIGYSIDAVPHLGYKIRKRPDKLIPEELKLGLNTKTFGKTITSYKDVSSTNTLAYGLAEHGSAEGTVVFAERQTKGKGRIGRKWDSPKGGIYMSCIIRPHLTPRNIQIITLIAAYAIAESIEKATGLSVQIKWPNDIYMENKKVCGILTEMKAESDRVDFLILGIGINVNTESKKLPLGAGSLSMFKKHPISKVELAIEVLRMLEKHYEHFKRKGFSAIRKEILKKSMTLGNFIKVKIKDKYYEGIAHDIDEEGALLLRLDNGSITRILSGDVGILHEKL